MPIHRADKPQSHKENRDTDKKDNSKTDSTPEPSITHNTVTIDGTELAYTATAREMLLKTDDGKKKARVFFVAYTKDGAENAAERPVTFCFNGGPRVFFGLAPHRDARPTPRGAAQRPPSVRDRRIASLTTPTLYWTEPILSSSTR